MASPPSKTDFRASSLSLLAMTAFAANSILCRLALASGEIDAASFTIVRLAAGALTLWLLSSRFQPRPRRDRIDDNGDWLSALMLFIYAAAFSYAYLNLNAATGALILFGAVQLTMVVGAVLAGEYPPAAEWLGLVLAAGGLVYLLLPGLSAPPLAPALLMTLSGAAWGVYSLRGRKTVAPLAATAGNFGRSIPFALLLGLATLWRMHLNPAGLLLAIASGALASGLGYVLWFAALRRLTATRAASVQLSVPVLAAVGGFLFLDESLTARWIIAATVVLGGIAMSLFSRRRPGGSRP